MNQTLTIVAITSIAILAILYDANYAKDLNIAVVSGLIGYLSGDKK